MLRSCLVVSVLAGAVLSSAVARVARADEPVPAGYHVERSSDGETIAAVGGVLAVLGYGTSAAFGLVATPFCAGSCTPSPALLFVPIVGPLEIANSTTGSWRTVYMVEGGAQAVGVGLMALGLVTHLASPKRLVRDRAPEARVHVAPLLGGGTTGLALGGTF